MNTPSYANASLYVGDLNGDITETQLFDIFKQAGPVASIRVCRDAVTRRSLGYAYVNYHSVEDAERALDLLNYKEIKGRPCRIMWSHRDPQLRRSNQGNIFVKNLPKSVDNKTLYDNFASFGNILSCKVATDEHGNSKGYGFIHYDTQESADKAIENMNSKSINGKKCFVGPFVPKKQRSKDDIDAKWTNIYAKYLDKSIDDNKLREMFSKYGTITSAVIMIDDKTNESKGFGFINFETNEQAQAAIDDLNGKELDGKQLYVGRAQKKGEREKELKEMFLKIQRERMSKYQGVNLYVKNLDETIDDEKLRTEFSTCGTITSAKVMTDEKKGSKGFGFVCFSTPEEATKAVTELNGKILCGKPIYVALAQRKDQRRAQLEAQFAQKANGIRLQQQAQATGMTGSPIYPQLFYANRNFVYPPNAMPMTGVTGGRGRFPNQRGMPNMMGGGFVGAPNQSMQMGGRGVGVQRGGRGGSRGGRGGHNVGVSNQGGYPQQIKYNPNVRNQQVGQMVPQNETNPMVMTEDRRQQIGEALYPQIQQLLKNSNQEEQTGKITGMILESMDQPELMHLIENPDALGKKVAEGLQVLAAHSGMEQKTEGQ